MAVHAEDALRGPGIAEVLDLALAVAAAEAARAKRLVAGEDGQVLDFVAASMAAVRAVVAYEGAVAEEEEVRVRVEEGAAGVAAEALDVPPIAGCARGRRGSSSAKKKLGLVKARGVRGPRPVVGRNPNPQPKIAPTEHNFGLVVRASSSAGSSLSDIPNSNAFPSSSICLIRARMEGKRQSQSNSTPISTQ